MTRAWIGGMTPRISTRSTFVRQLGACAVYAAISVSCAPRGEADTSAPAPPRQSASPEPTVAAPPAVPRETRLGVPDKGIWSDLDDQIQIDLPAGLTGDHVSAR